MEFPKITASGVLRIHGSWAKPDALSGMEQSWKLGNTAGNGGVVQGRSFAFRPNSFFVFAGVLHPILPDWQLFQKLQHARPMC